MIRFEQAQRISGEQLTIGEMTEDYFVLCMNRAFNDVSTESNGWILKKHNIERLEGMKACYGEASINPYDQLIRAIKRLGSIKVWRAFPNNSEIDFNHESSDTPEE